MVPWHREGPRRPTGPMKAARHCERPAGHSGMAEAGRGLSPEGMPMSGQALTPAGPRGPALTPQRPLRAPDTGGLVNQGKLAVREWPPDTKEDMFDELWGWFLTEMA